MSEQEFDLTIAEEGRVLRVAPVGELDLVGVPRIRQAIGERAGHDALVLDLRGLTFIDSSGIELLVALGRGEAGVPARFVAPGEQVRWALEIAGVADRLEWIEPG